MRICRLPVAYDDPRTYAAECLTSVRFTAQTTMPNEFTFIQVAQGQGVVGSFRYCRNHVCASGSAVTAEEEGSLRAAVVCDPNPLVLTISEMPSRDCTVWISGWRRNTAEAVQVVSAAALDSYGNHANGIQLFGVTPDGMTMGISPSNMSGFRGPDGNYGKAYPWKLRVFACPGQSGAGVNCFNYRTTPGPFRMQLAVRQKGARQANVDLDGVANLRGGVPGLQGPGGAQPSGGGVPGGAGPGGAAMGTPLRGQIVCSTTPLVIRISGLPSQTCTIWISGWRRNTADRVQVMLPDARDSYGNHDSGIQIFGAVRQEIPAWA